MHTVNNINSILTALNYSPTVHKLKNKYDISFQIPETFPDNHKSIIQIVAGERLSELYLENDIQHIIIKNLPLSPAILPNLFAGFLLMGNQAFLANAVYTAGYIPFIMRNKRQGDNSQVVYFVILEIMSVIGVLFYLMGWSIEDLIR